MAVTENTMTGAGDGSTNSFSFTFPYLKTTDLKVELVRTTTADGTTTKTILDSTKFTFPTATSVALSSFTDTDTDGNGVLRNTWQAYDTGKIKVNGGGYTYSGKVYRSTSSDALAATFYPGSAIRSADLNDNYTQNLYVTQEASNLVTDANTDSAAALTKATTADTNATTALANSRLADGATPTSPGGGYTSAIYLAKNAETTANAADTIANKAINDAAAALNYTIVADKATLIALNLAAADDGDFYEVTDATGINNFTGNITAGSAVIANVTTSSKPAVGDVIVIDTGGGSVTLATGTKVASIDTSANTITLNTAFGGSSSATGATLSSGAKMTWLKADGISAQTPNPDTMTGVTWDDKITVKIRWRGDTGEEKWEYVSYRNVDPESNYIRSASPTFTGTIQSNATLTVGVDDTGYDVKFFGDTASAYLLWDTSADSLLTGGSATIDIVKDKLKIGGTAVTTTAAELNTLDGFTGAYTDLNYIDVAAAGTAEVSKAVVLDGSKNITGLNNVTITGDLTVNGTTTTVNQTNLDVSDNIIGLNRGASTNANDSGIIIERGSTGDNAIIAWDESADKFTLGTTTATPSDTGDITLSALGTLVVGTLEDSKGNVRNIPASTNSTLVAADAGKHISITAGITINASTDFAIGDAVTIFNNQAAGNDETITATGIDLYLATDPSVSGATNRTLAPRGVATILCVAADKYVITGAGLS